MSDAADERQIESAQGRRAVVAGGVSGSGPDLPARLRFGLPAAAVVLVDGPRGHARPVRRPAARGAHAPGLLALQLAGAPAAGDRARADRPAFLARGRAEPGARAVR